MKVPRTTVTVEFPRSKSRRTRNPLESFSWINAIPGQCPYTAGGALLRVGSESESLMI
jgi:hypothetical protein